MATKCKAKAAPIKRKPRAPGKVETPRERFLRLLAEFGNITLAANGCSVSRKTIYEWRKTDPDFAADWLEAEQVAADHLEAEVRRRGVAGVNEPVFYQGKRCGEVQRYSDSLLMFLTKAKRPEFRDRMEHSGPNGAAIPLNISVKTADLSDEELLELITRARGSGGADPPATG